VCSYYVGFRLVSLIQFIFSLFNKALKNSGCRAWNDWMISEQCTGKGVERSCSDRMLGVPVLTRRDGEIQFIQKCVTKFYSNTFLLKCMLKLKVGVWTTDWICIYLITLLQLRRLYTAFKLEGWLWRVSAKIFRMRQFLPVLRLYTIFRPERMKVATSSLKLACIWINPWTT
jgi:hypothetical protein